MASEGFRRQLRHESERWRNEGLIDPALHEQLAQRYQFDQLESEANSRFIFVLLGLGAILLGLAAITFVAANWQGWDRSFKVALLLSCYVGVNAAGFYLWRGSRYRRLQRLGHGLLLLGGMLLGAGLGLMSQLFHQTGELYELMLVWGLGVAAMAYSLRLGSLGMLGLIILSIGYLSNWWSWSSISDAELSWMVVLFRHAPLVVSVLFIPLAYWCRSRALFILSAIGISLSLLFNLLGIADWNQGWTLALAFGLPPLLLWGFSDRAWRLQPRSRPAMSANEQPANPRSFASLALQPLTRSVAVCFLSVLFYLLAFQGWWGIDPYPSSVRMPLYHALIDAVILTAIAGLGWLQLLSDWRRQGRSRSTTDPSLDPTSDLAAAMPQSEPQPVVQTGTIFFACLCTMGIFISQLHLTDLTFIPTGLFNLLLFLLALALIRDGLVFYRRHTFWGGMSLLVIGIISRMLEYNTGLLLKSFVFLLCGIGIIVAGLWFERNHIRQSSTPSYPPPPSPTP
jgi:uncharacterized membrane protein